MSCQSCSGTGVWEEHHPYGSTFAVEYLTCDSCHGTGAILDRDVQDELDALFDTNIRAYEKRLDELRDGEGDPWEDLMYDVMGER